MRNNINPSDVEQYKLLNPLLCAMYSEIQELSKKKPDTPLNNYKIKSINRVLEPIKELLEVEDTYGFLDILDADDVPTNSDVVLILSQYIKSMDMFYSKYYRYTSKGWRWLTEQGDINSVIK